MIKMNQVTFQYMDSEEGVFDICLTIEDGECVVFTGPSGGGKTTLTRLINGLAPRYYPGEMSGEILHDERPLSSLKSYEIGREIGSVFQDPKSQFFSSELAGEVAFACENYGLSKDEICRRTDAAIGTFGLDALCHRSLDVLSSGEKQRVAIASVYAVSPKVYVCDEPTANLDNRGAAQLAETFKQLKSEGCTLVIAEHRLLWLHGIADRFVYIRNGHIQWEHTAAEMNCLSPEQRAAEGLREISKSEVVELCAPPGGTPALCVQGLGCRKMGIEIFSNLSFLVYHGQITAITGHNGAGKTSLALVLSGLWRENTGSVEIGDTRRSAKQRRRLIWYSSNDTGTQFFTNSVTEELLLNSERSSKQLDQVRTLLKELDLYAYKDAHPATLSGGQKQRLSIACGILSHRRILIFDEPTSGLDGGNMGVIAKIIRKQANADKCILVITHDKELMRCCCDCTISLDHI